MVANIKWVAKAVLTLACTLSLIQPTFGAQTAIKKSLTRSQVRATSKPSTQQLLRLVFPDLNGDGIAHTSVQIRNFHADYEPEVLSGEMSIRPGARTQVHNAGRSDILLEVEVEHKQSAGLSAWGNEMLLCLFRNGPHPKLLDLVDVKCDREGGLWSNPALLHAGLYDTPIIYFSHLNAGEDYLGLEIVEIVGNKFVPSRAKLPMFYSIRLQHSDITETPTLQSIPHSDPPEALFKLKFTGKLLEETNDTAKKTVVKNFVVKLKADKGRWTCPGCKAVTNACQRLEKTFGLNDDQ